ncbi:MAG: ATP-binding cassette domain-containing protein, partial [Kordiimonadaceae bacterium]|nr:ATP-binding cassette domain-containing protein [Kordiimonadaceae bacterium]
LYPHMSVEKNISFGLRAAKMDKALIKEKVAAAAEILELEELMDRKPAELSGGQRQRVAMGRAMVREPDVFLFDEPLSNLDAKLRASMRLEIKRLHERLKTTIIYVTHDQMEAMTLADRIVILKDGEIQQIGSPMELYQNPANQFVAGFIGSPEMNFLAGEDGKTMGIRPEDIYLAGSAPELSEAKRMNATLQVSEPLGAETLLTFDFEGQGLTVKVPGVATVEAGAEVELVIDGGKVCFFGMDGERC